MDELPEGNGSASPLAYAQAYLRAGLCVIPIRPDGSKAASVRWKPFQEQRPDESQIRLWWNDQHSGIAIVCGEVSGNREVIDFDLAEVFDDWQAQVETEAPGLASRLCTIRTPRPGFQVHYSCDEIEGNRDLALRIIGGEQKAIIQTRGTGGYVLVPGSPASCHKTGRLYRHCLGPPITDAPRITPAERAILFRAAQSFNEVVEAAVVGGGERPGDAFNRSSPDWSEILTPGGWTVIRQSGTKRYWRRPGKENEGWSATSGVCTSKDGIGLLAVFSSNAAPFEGPTGGKPCTCYSPFAAYALLNHNGDYKAAAKALAGKGFGEQRTGKGDSRQGQPKNDPAEKTKPEWQPVVVTVSTVQAQSVEWLWRGFIPFGALTLLDGDPGNGKSTIVGADVAARVSRGLAMPSGNDPPADPAGVLLLSAEDDLARTIRPRLDAAGADISRVHVLTALRAGNDERPPVLPWDLTLVEKLIAERGIRLVSVDPFMAYLDSEIDSHKDQDIRRCLHRLKMLAEKTGVAIVVIRHLNKLIGGPAMYRGGGSIGVIGAVRSALLVGRDPTNPDTCILAPVKCNLCKMPKSLAYTHEPVGDVSRIGWIGESDLKADDILIHSGGRRKASAAEQAAEAIKEILTGGAMDSKALDDACQARGFTGNAVKTGRRLAGVKSSRVGYGSEGRWMVTLPVKGDDKGVDEPSHNEIIIPFEKTQEIAKEEDS